MPNNEPQLMILISVAMLVLYIYNGRTDDESAG